MFVLPEAVACRLMSLLNNGRFNGIRRSVFLSPLPPATQQTASFPCGSMNFVYL